MSLVPDASDATFYREGPGRDLTDVRFRAAIGDARGQCDYRGDTLRMDMAVLLLAERGPALGDREPADFEYFVALTDEQRRIVSKAVFKGRVVFPAGQDTRGKDVCDFRALPHRLRGLALSVEGFQLCEIDPLNVSADTAFA